MTILRFQAPRTRWVTKQQLPQNCPKATLRCWLFDPASLTQRVQQACAGTFRVRVERQGWGRPRLDECRVLGLRSARRALIREVHLLCDEQPWVFARTIIPVTTLRGPQRQLAHLGSRPLGALLFADPQMRRGVVEVSRIVPGDVLFTDAVAGLRQPPAEIWGRRSVFWLGGKPLLVSEIFLPGIGDCAAPRGQGRR